MSSKIMFKKFVVTTTIAISALGLLVSPLVSSVAQTKTDTTVKTDQSSKILSKNKLFSSPKPASPSYTNLFDDVPKDFVFADPIYNLLDKGVINGYTPQIFSPYGIVTRGAMAKFIANGILGDVPFDINDCVGENFTDVDPDNDVFYPYYRKLQCLQVISGYTDPSDSTKFMYKPNDSVTRGQTAKFVIEALRVRFNDSNFLPKDDASLSSLNDISDYPLKDYITAAYKIGIVSGYADSTYRPNDDITRGGMAKLVWFGMLSKNFKVDLVKPSDETGLGKTVDSLFIDPCTDTYQDAIGSTYYSDYSEPYGFMSVENKNFVMSSTSITSLQDSFDIVNKVKNYTTDGINDGGCGDGFSYYMLGELPAVTYSKTDAVRAKYDLVFGGGSPFGIVSVNIDAISGDNYISLYSSVDGIDSILEGYTTTCENADYDLFINCMKDKVLNDATIKTKVDDTANYLTTRFAL